jgi:DNA-binding Lrp family transcriptional regulator
MKKTEIKVLANLRKDGRVPLTELSRKTNLPVSTIHDRMRKNIETGLIKPTVLFDFEKLGFDTRVQILLSVEQTEKEKLLAHLKEHPNVNSLFRINNGWNVIMECIFKNMPDSENFVEQLEQEFHIKQKEVHYVLEELKREGFLTKQEQAEKILG